MCQGHKVKLMPEKENHDKAVLTIAAATQCTSCR